MGESDTPVAIVGAGRLVSQVYRNPGGGGYRFNIIRSEHGLVGNEFSECDLRDLLKLCHVLTFAVIDDGWIDERQGFELRRLLEELESVTHPSHSADSMRT